MITLSLKAIGLNVWAKRLFNKAKQIRNKRRQLMARLAVLGFKDVQDHFRKEEGPPFKIFGTISVSPWQGLSDATLAKRRKGKRKGKAKILQDTGFLKNSLVPNIGRKVVKANSIILSAGGVRKSLVETYAGIHDKGLFGMPQRKFMWISKEGQGKMVMQIVKFLKK